MQVPLVIRLPDGDQPGLVIEPPIRGIDLMPALLEVAGVDPGAQQMQDCSLVGLWKWALGYAP
jgi:arylsulfatase A-like enzyme